MILFFSTIVENDLDRKFQRQVEKSVGNKNLVRFATTNDTRNRHLSFFTPWDLSPFSSEFHSPVIPELEKWVRRYSECHKSCTQVQSRNRLNGFANFIEGVFRQAGPELVMVNSNSVANTGIPYEIAKAMGIPAITYERGYLPGSFQIEPYGSGPFSSLSNLSFESVVQGDQDSIESLKRIGKRFIESRFKGFRGRNANHSFTKACAAKRAEPTSRIKVLFLPIVDETFSVFPIEHSDHSKVMGTFRSSLDTAIFLSRMDFDLVVKPHPSDMKPEKWKSLPDSVFLSHGQVSEWIDWCDVVVINGGTLEFLAMAKGKPVVLSGRSVMSNKGIVYESNRDNVQSVITEAAQRGIVREARERFEIFVGWLKSYYLIFPDSNFPNRTIRRRIGDVCENVEFMRPCSTKELVELARQQRLTHTNRQSELMSAFGNFKRMVARILK